MRLELACDLLTGFMSSLFLFDSEKKSLNFNKIKYYFTYVWLEDLKVFVDFLKYYHSLHFEGFFSGLEIYLKVNFVK